MKKQPPLKKLVRSEIKSIMNDMDFVFMDLVSTNLNRVKISFNNSKFVCYYQEDVDRKIRHLTERLRSSISSLNKIYKRVI